MKLNNTFYNAEIYSVTNCINKLCICSCADYCLLGTLSSLLSIVLRTGCDILDNEMELFTPFQVMGNDQQQQEYQQQQGQVHCCLLFIVEH